MAKNDEAWWSQHGLRIRGVQSRQGYGDYFVHYNACVLLAGDIERIVGIVVPENPCEVLASAPTAEMPRTLLAFKVALRQMSADNCLPFGVHAPSANVIRQLALIELLEMRYVDLPLREAPLIALVQEARLRRRNVASTHGADAGGALQPSMLPITGEEVVAHLMAYVRQTRYLDNNAAFLRVKAKTEADQIEALRALVENAHMTILTNQVTSQGIDVRQLASLVAYYSHLQMTTSQTQLRAWTKWLKRRRS